MTRVTPAAVAAAVANNWIQCALDMKMANPSRQNHKKLDHHDIAQYLPLCLQDMREAPNNTNNNRNCSWSTAKPEMGI